MRLQTSSLAKNDRLTKRIVIGFVAFAAAAIVGTAGMASAYQNYQSANGYGGGGTNINVEANGNGNIIYVIVNVTQKFYNNVVFWD